MDENKDERFSEKLGGMGCMTLTDDDRLWRHQNFPNMTDKEFGKIIDTFGNGKGEAKDNKKIKETYMQRFSNEQYYAEAVLVANKQKFLSVNQGEIQIVDSIQLEDEIIKPLKALSYINKPYSFSSEQEVNDYITKANYETLDSLYATVKSIWKKYVDADDFHISICAADTIFTYYQNVAGMTHYLFFVGGPGSGKSNNLEVFHNLAYRNMTSTGITAPNIYAFYGGREEGFRPDLGPVDAMLRAWLSRTTP